MRLLLNKCQDAFESRRHALAEAQTTALEEMPPNMDPELRKGALDAAMLAARKTMLGIMTFLGAPDTLCHRSPN